MRSIPVLVCLVAFATAVCAAEPRFTDQLTPEERQAAGLETLSPEQREALDRLAERFADTRAGTVREQAKREAREETQRELEAKEEARAVAKAGLADDGTVVHSRIAGPFKGWSGATLFTLENGQVWRQANPGDRLWIPLQESPAIEIRRTSFGWKLRLVERGSWLYVRRVK